MKKEILRSKFSEYLNDDTRYRKFVRHINKGYQKRLLFWQEKELETFSNENSIAVPNYEELEEAFRICEIHGAELQKGKVKVFNGNIDCTREYEEACIELFPNSWLGPINGPKEKYGKNLEIWYCPLCRSAEQKWSKSHA